MHIDQLMTFVVLIIWHLLPLLDIELTPSYEAGASPSPDNSHPGALKKEIQWKKPCVFHDKMAVSLGKTLKNMEKYRHMMKKVSFKRKKPGKIWGKSL